MSHCPFFQGGSIAASNEETSAYLRKCVDCTKLYVLCEVVCVMISGWLCFGMWFGVWCWNQGIGCWLLGVFLLMTWLRLTGIVCAIVDSFVASGGQSIDRGSGVFCGWSKTQDSISTNMGMHEAWCFMIVCNNTVADC